MFDLFGYASTVAVLVYPMVFVILWFALKGVRAYIKHVSEGRYDFTLLTKFESKILSRVNARGNKVPRGFLVFTMVVMLLELTILFCFGVNFILTEQTQTFTASLMDVVHVIAKALAPVMGWIISVLGSLFAFHIVASIAIKSKMRLDDVHAASEKVLAQAKEIDAEKEVK